MLPLSPLSRGHGKWARNKQKVEVYFEPEDYVNWKSPEDYVLVCKPQDEGDPTQHTWSLFLPKTYSTRKGVLILYSEGLALPAWTPRERRRGPWHPKSCRKRLGPRRLPLRELREAILAHERTQETLTESHHRLQVPEESHHEKTQPASRRAFGHAHIDHPWLPSDRPHVSFYGNTFPDREADLSDRQGDRKLHAGSSSHLPQEPPVASATDSGKYTPGGVKKKKVSKTLKLPPVSQEPPAVLDPLGSQFKAREPPAELLVFPVEIHFHARRPSKERVHRRGAARAESAPETEEPSPPPGPPLKQASSEGLAEAPARLPAADTAIAAASPPDGGAAAQRVAPALSPVEGRESPEDQRGPDGLGTSGHSSPAGPPNVSRYRGAIPAEGQANTESGTDLNMVLNETSPLTQKPEKQAAPQTSEAAALKAGEPQSCINKGPICSNRKEFYTRKLHIDMTPFLKGSEEELDGWEEAGGPLRAGHPDAQDPEPRSVTLDPFSASWAEIIQKPKADTIQKAGSGDGRSRLHTRRAERGPGRPERRGPVDTPLPGEPEGKTRPRLAKQRAAAGIRREETELMGNVKRKKRTQTDKSKVPTGKSEGKVHIETKAVVGKPKDSKAKKKPEPVPKGKHSGVKRKRPQPERSGETTAEPRGPEVCGAPGTEGGAPDAGSPPPGLDAEDPRLSPRAGAQESQVSAEGRSPTPTLPVPGNTESAEDGSPGDPPKDLLAKREQEKARWDRQRAERAEKRRLEVERKRREQEEQRRLQREQLEWAERMKEELELEQRRREEETRLRTQQQAEERRQQAEEESRRQAAQERARRRQEELQARLQALQSQQRQEEAARAEVEKQRQQELEKRLAEEHRRLADAAVEQRLEQQRRRQEAEEEARLEAEERRQREAAARLALEEAEKQAQEHARQKSALRKHLRFYQELHKEADGLQWAHNISRPWVYSYFQFLQIPRP